MCMLWTINSKNYMCNGENRHHHDGFVHYQSTHDHSKSGSLIYYLRYMNIATVECVALLCFIYEQ